MSSLNPQQQSLEYALDRAEVYTDIASHKQLLCMMYIIYLVASLQDAHHTLCLSSVHCWKRASATCQAEGLLQREEITISETLRVIHWGVWKGARVKGGELFFTWLFFCDIWHLSNEAVGLHSASEMVCQFWHVACKLLLSHVLFLSCRSWEEMSICLRSW